MKNSIKKVIENHILECVYSDTDENYTNLKEACIRLNNEFERVANYPYNLQKFPNNIDRFVDYLQGIPFCFEFENYKIEEFLNSFVENKKKYSSDKMWYRYGYLIYTVMIKNL